MVKEIKPHRTEDTTSQPIHIPTWQEIAYADTTHGLLFADEGCLCYLDISAMKKHKLAEINGYCRGIACFEDDVYYNINVRYVKSLFAGSAHLNYRSSANFLHRHKDRLLDCGRHGIRDILNDRSVIHMEDIHCCFHSFQSLSTDSENNLFALVRHIDSQFSLFEIKEDLDYPIGDTVVHYKVDVSQGQAMIIPHGSIYNEQGTKRPFSIISCVYPNYLDLNGKKIDGTESDHKISRVMKLSHKGNMLEVAYLSDHGGIRIRRAMINLDIRKAESEELPIHTPSLHRGLEVVTDYQLHKRLIAEGKKK